MSGSMINFPYINWIYVVNFPWSAYGSQVTNCLCSYLPYHLLVQTEISLMEMVSHPNILKVLGFCRANEEQIIVYEYMQKRGLDYHLFSSMEKFLLFSIWSCILQYQTQHCTTLFLFLTHMFLLLQRNQNEYFHGKLGLKSR